MTDAFLTFAIAVVLLVFFGLSADAFGWWKDRRARRPRRGDVLDAADRFARRRAALGEAVWGRRGR